MAPHPDTIDSRHYNPENSNCTTSANLYCLVAARKLGASIMPTSRFGARSSDYGPNATTIAIYVIVAILSTVIVGMLVILFRTIRDRLRGRREIPVSPHDGAIELAANSVGPRELAAPVPGWRVPNRRDQSYGGYYTPAPVPQQQPGEITGMEPGRWG
ncbi:hypothetical protein NA57DRAFT_74630 [Rhizodiscina lignyota]|uniref:Uncharacterized protein n=1 Tax=Rhizodiscina lignyota TaxID=1504668 RepID=A0A9P4MB53_9PEZI|nr:hypothetical protein NA57DRAFT_74630 [Rhizodiscina lignyota]